MIETAILGGIGILTVAAAVGVVATRNVVYAAVFLLISLVGVAALFLMMLAEFIALAQVLIYGGAITIVLLFGIMLTRAPEQANLQDNEQRPLAAMACIGLFALLVAGRVDDAMAHPRARDGPDGRVHGVERAAVQRFPDPVLRLPHWCCWWRLWGRLC